MSRDQSSDIFANRDEGVPMLKINDEDASSHISVPDTPREGSILRRAMSPSGLREKSHAAGSSSLADGVQDRLFSLIFEQAMPGKPPPEAAKPDPRCKKAVERPGFSLPMMSANFRRFNARIGVVFVFQNRAIRLLSWRNKTQTWCFLAVFSFCCLDPSLLAVLPLATCLLFIMVPAFIARHPPPPNSQATDLYDITGPASAPPANIKPAPDMSKDFRRNMRDLQNSMEDFSVMHDQVIAFIGPLTNFSNERLSSTLFLALVLTSFMLFIASGLLPWRLLFLAGGWIAIVVSHPDVASLIASLDTTPIIDFIKRRYTRLQKWMEEDMILDEVPEVREVEIFELQRKHGDDWQAWIFSVSSFTPQSPKRVSGDRPRGTRFFEDVQPPKGWEWSSKKWTLDLFSREWVEERMITAVEVETDGERWVYDLDNPQPAPGLSSATPQKGAAAKKIWEEGSGTGPKGEWRRRRWVRLVKRKKSLDKK